MNYCNNFSLFQALYSDIIAHKEQLNRLEEKAGQVKDNLPKSKIAEIKSRFSILLDHAKVNVMLAYNVHYFTPQLPDLTTVWSTHIWLDNCVIYT